MQVNIVIPHYNGKRILRHCLASIQNQTYTDFLVTVVDNGSTDGSLEMLAQEFPSVKVLSWSENRGFCQAVNAGITDADTPLIFLLNNDTELAQDCLAELVNAVLEHDGYDFFAAKLYNYNDHSRLDGAGDGFLRGGVGYRLGTMEKDSEHYSVSRQVFGACGGAALYRRSFFDHVGLFDNDFFAYLEDVDLNFRANSRGKKCWFVADAKVYHIGSATTGSKINNLTVELSTRNNLNVLVKNYPLRLFLQYLPVIFLYQIFWILFVIKKRQFLAYLRGIVSFVSNFSGIRDKRRENLKAATVRVKELHSLLCCTERDVIHSIMKRREESDKSNWLFSLYLRWFL